MGLCFKTFCRTVRDDEPVSFPPFVTFPLDAL